MSLLEVLPPTLKAWREHRHLTQSQLAERAGVTQTHIGNIESRRNLANLEVMLKIATVLNCSVDDLAKGVMPPPQPEKK